MIISPILPTFGLIDEITGALESHEIKSASIVKVSNSLPLNEFESLNLSVVSRIAVSRGISAFVMRIY